VKGGLETSGGKLRNRHGPAGSVPWRSDDPGDFLARIWTLVGPPDAIEHDGFAYRMRDRQSGLSFSAYSGASGPAYAGARRDAAALASVLDDFDLLLDATPLADCLIEYGSGIGRVQVGASHGRPFERPAGDVRPELEAKMVSARQLLIADPVSVWDDIGMLVELSAARGLAGQQAYTGAPDYDEVSRGLWLRAIARIEEFAAGTAGSDAEFTAEIEPLIDVALVQLRESAEQGAVTMEEADGRLRAVELRLRALRARRSPGGVRRDR
jgi:hypothetical protein